MRIDYAEYLRSPGWAAQRERALHEAHHRCVRCGRHSDESGYVDDSGREIMVWVQLDVHHLTYERLGAELPEDLAVLCHRCHEETHAGEALGRVMARPELKTRLDAWFAKSGAQ